MSELRRNQTNNINRLLDSFPAVLVLGVRQCGKSTLVKSIRTDWKYFDLENSRDFDYISSDPNFFLKENPKNIIIDEAQELPGFFKDLRGVIDQARDEKNRFILTGSSSPELIKMASDSLAGRIGIVELGTFKLNELKENPLPEFYKIFENKLDDKTFDLIKSLVKPKNKIDPLNCMLKGGLEFPKKSGQHLLSGVDFLKLHRAQVA